MTRNELYTTGGEFFLPDGSDYIGGYHVHFSRGAMVGSFHKVEPHSRLTPVNDSVRMLVESIMEELTGKRTVSTSSSPRVSSGGASGGY